MPIMNNIFNLPLDSPLYGRCTLFLSANTYKKGNLKMEKIGEFAKRCQTTIKTLRFYDQLGLLIPDYIDTFTGYRYYGPGKVAEMRQITELKDIGFTLEEIKRYCEALNDDMRNHIIEEKHWSLMKLAEDTAHQLEKLEAIKRNLRNGEKKMAIDMNAPFENDERIIGRWEFIATVDKKEYFKPGNEYNNETIYEELYFLPDGEPYWGFGWTKGYIKITFGDGMIVPYELDEVDGQTFMFVDHPSYGSVWVLKQTDNARHTVYSIAENDDVNLPFVDDPQVHGGWASIDYVSRIEDFNPARQQMYNMYMKSVEFFSDGVFEWTYSEKYKHRWTKGTAMISYWNNGQLTHTTAPAYEIRVIEGVEYLFFEWKNGDYTWGKMKPGYYVLRRGVPEPEPTIHFNMPFENDETMVGRWEMVATVEKGEDFIPGQTYDNDSSHKEIYFLPEGKWYWAFSWTKGYIKVSGGGDKLCPYTFKEIDGERYIFAEYKNEYGLMPIWVLRQTDNKSYTAYEIGQWDNIDLPFIDDPAVHGIWISMDYVDEMNIFDPKKRTADFTLWLREMDFLPDGRARKRYNNNDQSQKAHWTKGTLLEQHFGEGGIASAYTLRTINGEDYLFFEWKSGDYIWGKMKPSYYVFRKN